MESELLPEKKKNTPPVPAKTYQWEDLRRAREAGAYPWTHLLKEPLELIITAEDIIRETTPRRSMSREISRSRTRSPVDRDVQKILNLDSSPGSSRKHGEEGKDEGVHIPNFSKEVSLDSEEDVIKEAIKTYVPQPESQTSGFLTTPLEIPKNVSPKGILKRRAPETHYIGVTETREKTKCCHPLVNKIKHLADKTLHKLERSETEKSPTPKRKKNETSQEIMELKSSPGASRRQKFGAIKLGDSDEMSKSICTETPPPRKKKEHIYEDIDEKSQNNEKSLQFAIDTEKNINDDDVDDVKQMKQENESLCEKKSNASQDPSLVTDDNTSLKPEEHVMEILHSKTDNTEANILDDEMDPEEPNVDEIFQNQLDEDRLKNESPNITITEIIDDTEVTEDHNTTVPIETSPTPSPVAMEEKKADIEFANSEWSKPSSDHEYEIIEKPSPDVDYNTIRISEKLKMIKTDDELSSSTSLEGKYLQHTSDEDDHTDENRNEDIDNAEALQKDIEDRYFLNTPSTVSRTECEVSTSQVDSSALENLPLRRESRSKNTESLDNKIQQRIKEGTGKLKSQAGKLKTKLQNIKTTQFSIPERAKFKLPPRPKISFPDRPKFNLPERRKFSLPERPKFKKINISEKLSLGDRKKFTFPERPKFNVPELPKFKLPERPKINFPSLNRKKTSNLDNTNSGSASEFKTVTTVEFETKTYPRLFGRKEKVLPKTSSSPTLYREDTPPGIATFARMKKSHQEPFNLESPEQPREYGNIDSEMGYDQDMESCKQFDETYDFDNVDNEFVVDSDEFQFKNNRNTTSTTDISPSKQEYTHVINEINNDEFFVRPRGISRENIQVREYLSDEIRQAFKIPKNVLASMGNDSKNVDENIYVNEPEADPELMLDENDQINYSVEDINDRDDGYYTFPPIRPSRAKRKKKEQEESLQYIDQSINASLQFSEVDLGLAEEHGYIKETFQNDQDTIETECLDVSPAVDLRSIHEYANDDILVYPDTIPVQSQTLPMPPKRKKKNIKKDYRNLSLNDLKQASTCDWEHQETDDVVVYRTEHEYIVPHAVVVAEHSPLPPRRNRSRSSRGSRGTSLCDDDRTSHGAESLTLDTHGVINDEEELERDIRQESPGYAVVDKGYAPSKSQRRSKSKTPPPRRKSHSSERKYYTVGPTIATPDRPPRKKSSTSLMTLDSLTKWSLSADYTQYVEIDEPQVEEMHKNLKSGEIISKMKDRPLPPPPRPPRGSKKGRKDKSLINNEASEPEKNFEELERAQSTEVVEIEVSTQTDPLPDDIDFELGMDENLDISMSSSLRDIMEDSVLSKVHGKTGESPRFSRPTSRSEKSLKLSDPKISELSKSPVGRTSPTVILVERRVSSPTRINEREEMLTEASLTVQHIDIDESQIPDVPPLPKSRGGFGEIKTKSAVPAVEDRALERVSDVNSIRDIHLDNLVTQRLQVRDLDVGRLNVSELQASKILVSDIEGMTLQVTELDSKSGHISVSGIEFSQSVIDEIVKKFAEITTTQTPMSGHVQDNQRPLSTEEQTQTKESRPDILSQFITEGTEVSTSLDSENRAHTKKEISGEQSQPLPPPLPPVAAEDRAIPPQRPPPPDLTPLLYSYLQDLSLPPASFYAARPPRERPFTEFHESQHHTPPPPMRRVKRKPTVPHSASSSEEERTRFSPRRMPPPVRSHEPTITEAGAQFLRVCHNSISRTIRHIFNSFMSYISGAEDKKDVQMALVIFLVLIAGLIMFGLSDSRTIHHHHWEFFNPPDGKQ